MANNSDVKWNIFARVLEKILHGHGYTLWQLRQLAEIHTEKIGRINRSLHEPKFNVLSPEDLDKTIVVCGFTPDETFQIRAAVLATAIEKMLMDRINANDALMAAEQVYPILYRALKKHGNDTRGLGEAKGVVTPLPMQSQAAEDEDESLEPVVDNLEAAILLLHLADTGEGEEGAQYARLARSRFLTALSSLEEMDDNLRSHQAWLVWHAEALSGLAHAEKRLTTESSQSS